MIIAGVAGSGKSTVGAALADRLGVPFADGDDFHPLANVAKMTAGRPLDDDDRRPWLAAIAEWIDARLGAGESAVVACSGLRQRYRDALTRPGVQWVYLRLSQEEAVRRSTARPGHFFAPNLVPSQFAALEEPGAGEPVITVDARTPVAEIVAQLQEALGGPDPREAGHPDPR